MASEEEVLDAQIKACDDASDRYRRAANSLRRVRAGIITGDPGDPDARYTMLPPQKDEELARASKFIDEAEQHAAIVDKAAAIVAADAVPIAEPILSDTDVK